MVAADKAEAERAQKTNVGIILHLKVIQGQAF